MSFQWLAESIRRIAAAVVVPALALSFPLAADGQQAEEEATFRGDGLTLRFPGWRRTAPSSSGPMPVILTIDSGGESLDDWRVCHLQRRNLPPSPGMTQEIVNDRLRSNMEAFSQTESVRALGRVESAKAVMIHGIVVADLVIHGETRGQAAYTRLRMFNRVDAAGEGVYYNLQCMIARGGNEAHRSEIEAIVGSLRFAD